jgi:nucleotide-binding universal stress UspA family protein
MAPYRAMIIPLDGSALAEQALAVALRLPGAAKATLVLVGAAPGRHDRDRSAAEPAGPGTPDQAEPLECYLRGVAQQLGADGFVARARLAIGAPAEAILRASSEEQADLIVMATHGRSGVSRLVLGSVAEEIVRHADLPVVLVRPSVAPETV